MIDRMVGAENGVPSGRPPDSPGDRPVPDPALPAPRLARTITVGVLVYYCGIAVLNVLWSGATAGRLAVCLVCVAVVFALQLFHVSPRARRWPLRRRCLTLGAQAALTYLPLAVFGLEWGSMAGPLAGSLLLLLPPRAAWPLFALIAAGMLALSLLEGSGIVMVVYLTTSTMMAGVILYGTARLSDLVTEVHASRGELARMAVSQERLRFARDLHDLLGYSLSAITLKSELIHRLITSRPDRAREEIASVLEVSRQALADVRLVASGYRDMSLADEADSAARILATADVAAEVSISTGRLHPVVETVLATTLREGMTNVLRHSKVENCTITAEADGDLVRLTLLNDGVTGTRRRSPHSGSGLGNLQTRLSAIGGRVEAGVQEDGRFRLLAEAPARPLGTGIPGDGAAGSPAAAVTAA
ncbi:sensor histidine kinase [Streptomyces sp. MNU89]|uniref:sensor histidine kinase n=1 Tax=Streptomyces sp. MNU89 TaxID=2560025 RepID=UPI001E4301D6|nr:histidine kinase [Streptomyces sp. MNU89]MCC9741375.1 histidine kinase [Streptomyces sp. MNU89]